MVERPYNEIATEWCLMGAIQASFHEAGLVHTDLNSENVLIQPEEGRIYFVDWGESDLVTYPDDWELLPVALSTLLDWLPTRYAAAFRFGYIQRGGPVAELVFKVLRDDYDFNGCIDLPGLCCRPPSKSESLSVAALRDLDQSWSRLRNSLPTGHISAPGLSTEASFDLDDLDKWRARRGVQGTVSDLLADEYHYRKHVVAAWHHFSLYHIFEALLNLHAVYARQQRWTMARGLAAYCRHLAQYVTDRTP